jgi:ADP-ribose pyrophosphatase
MNQNWEPEFTQLDYKIEQKQVMYSGYCPVVKYTIRYQLFSGGWSESVERDCVMRPPAVAVVLYDPITDEVVLIEQIRIAMMETKQSPWLLEIVAGVIEAGESAEDCAKREILEEAGCSVEELIPIYPYWVSPGISNEQITVFCGIVKALPTESSLGVSEDGEDIKVHVVSRQKALEWINEGRITSGPAIIGLQWLALNYSKLVFPK